MAEKLHEPALEIPPMDNHVKKTVFEKEFSPLKSFGQITFDRILDHPRSRKADECTGLADVDIPEHGI